MSAIVGYRVPAGRHQFEIVIARSRFIATADRTPSVEATRALLTDIRAEMPDATHHVYAFRVGFGNSVTEGMSDDGEPSGTAGPPVLAVVRGAEIGDVMVVVTRYFGGTKLGTGGLVRAYSEAARGVLRDLPTEEKIPRCRLAIELPYSLYAQIKRLLLEYNAVILDERFTADVAVTVSVALPDADRLSAQIIDLSSGKVVPVTLDEGEAS